MLKHLSLSPPYYYLYFIVIIFIYIIIQNVRFKLTSRIYYYVNSTQKLLNE